MFKTGDASKKLLASHGCEWVNYLSKSSKLADWPTEMRWIHGRAISWKDPRKYWEEWSVDWEWPSRFYRAAVPSWFSGNQVIFNLSDIKGSHSIGNLADRSKMLQPWLNTIHVTTSLLSLVGTVWSIVSKSGRLGEKSLSWQHVLCSCNRITKWHIVNRDFLQETLKAKKSKTLVSAEGL